jgi:acetyl-CoA carboxylase biotin carboxyl carrier protein
MSEPSGQQPIDDLQLVCEQAAALARSMPEPVQRISVRRGDCEVEVEWPTRHEAPQVSTAVASSSPVASDPPVAVDSAHQQPAESGHIVRAPLVGTFYRAAQPGAAPFVSIGDVVEVDQPLAIVEAMKLMNTITSDIAGRVVDIYVDNDQSVEFEQPLVRIVPGSQLSTNGQRAA